METKFVLSGLRKGVTKYEISSAMAAHLAHSPQRTARNSFMTICAAPQAISQAGSSRALGKAGPHHLQEILVVGPCTVMRQLLHNVLEFLVS